MGKRKRKIEDRTLKHTTAMVGVLVELDSLVEVDVVLRKADVLLEVDMLVEVDMRNDQVVST